MDTRDAGRIGGKSTSEAKRAAARKNGKAGGRPAKMQTRVDATGVVTGDTVSEYARAWADADGYHLTHGRYGSTDDYADYHQLETAMRMVAPLNRWIDIK